MPVRAKTNHCAECGRAGAWPMFSRGPLCPRCSRKLERAGRLDPMPGPGETGAGTIAPRPPCERCGIKHSPDEPEEACTWYLRETLTAAEEDVSRLEGEIAKREGAVKQAEGRVAMLESKVKELNALLAAPREPVATRGDEDRLRSRINELENDLRNAREAKERALEKQKGELESLRRRVDELRSQNEKNMALALEFAKALASSKCKCETCSSAEGKMCEKEDKRMGKIVRAAVDLFGEEGFIKTLTSMSGKEAERYIEALKYARKTGKLNGERTKEEAGMGSTSSPPFPGMR